MTRTSAGPAADGSHTRPIEERAIGIFAGGTPRGSGGCAGVPSSCGDGSWAVDYRASRRARRRANRRPGKRFPAYFRPMPDNPRQRSDVLFPEIDPYATGRLAVDARHTLYWETCGNHDGVPLVFLHGGPGGGCLPHHRRYFDPAFWRIVLFDQRGAGRSTPCGGARRQHDAASRRRPRAAAPASRHRAVAALRRLVGLDAGARLRRGASGALPRARAARDLPRPAGRARLVHARHAQRVSGSLARVLANSCRRPSATTCSAITTAASRTPIRPCTCRPRRHGIATKARARSSCPSDPLPTLRQRRRGARDRAHRGPLFRPSGVARARSSSSPTSGASGTCRARSSRDATTSSARR